MVYRSKWHKKNTSILYQHVSYLYTYILKSSLYVPCGSKKKVDIVVTRYVALMWSLVFVLIPIFGWYMSKFGVMKKHQKYMCYNEIG